MPDTPPKTPGQRKPFLLGVATGVLTASVAIGGTLMVVQDREKPPATADAKPTATATATASTVAQEETEEPAELYNTAPAPEDFTLSLKTTSKQCFGSAGCNVTVEPELGYDSILPVDPDETYSITYEVQGGSDGPIIKTMELSDQTSLSYQPVVMSTDKSSAKLTAKVTAVETSG
jgi:hypothetical protein